MGAAANRGDGVGGNDAVLSSLLLLLPPIDKDTSFLYGYVAVSADASDPPPFGESMAVVVYVVLMAGVLMAGVLFNCSANETQERHQIN